MIWLSKDKNNNNNKQINNNKLLFYVYGLLNVAKRNTDFPIAFSPEIIGH